jgi:hypothetical protein
LIFDMRPDFFPRFRFTVVAVKNSKVDDHALYWPTALI